MKWRMIVTILVVIFGAIVLHVYNAAQGPIEAKIAVAQIEDDVAIYAASRATIEYQLVPKMITGGGGILLLCIWVPFFIQNVSLKRKENIFKKKGKKE
jgi:hypothetical protein